MSLTQVFVAKYFHKSTVKESVTTPVNTRLKPHEILLAKQALPAFLPQI
jgi:hypothetical protein